MTRTRELIASAFGESACLYKHVLQCSRKATSPELRKAYHKRALCFHPDKQTVHKTNRNVQDNHTTIIEENTLRFQAVSAAYEILLDPKKRASYDVLGRLEAEDDDDSFRATSSSTGNNSVKEKDWIKFFKSVFQEMATANDDFDRKKYCGSDEEKEDVLKFYKLCKGDTKKILSCIVLGENSDIKRWKRDIIGPAIERGEVDKFGATDYSDDENGYCSNKKYKARSVHKKMRTIKRKGKDKQVILQNDVISTCDKKRDDNAGIEFLVDTDDEEEEEDVGVAATENVEKKMNRRDKLEFRVAKKQKLKKEKDIEISNIIKSKRWKVPNKQRQSHRPTQNAFNQSFLSSLERKYLSEEKR